MTRADHTVIVEPPGHVGVRSRRLLGGEAGGPEHTLVGLSDYPRGSGASLAPTNHETLYVVVQGALRVHSGDDDQSAELGVGDAAHLRRGEVRSVSNERHDLARLLVIHLLEQS